MPHHPPPRQSALVVFGDQSGLWLLRFLKRGFRHCFVILPLQPQEWLLINPLAQAIDYQSLNDGELLAALVNLTNHGYRMVPCPLNHQPLVPLQGKTWLFYQTIGLLRPFSCVSMVQKLLRRPANYFLTPAKLAEQLLQPYRQTTFPDFNV